MLKMLGELYRVGLLTPFGLVRLLVAVLTAGINPMALLQVAAKRFPNRVAVADDLERVTFHELWGRAESVARALHSDYGITPGDRVSIACHDHLSTIEAIFAASRLGAHVFLINPGIRPSQLTALHERLQFKLHIYDEPLAEFFANSPIAVDAVPAYHSSEVSIRSLSSPSNTPRPSPGRAIAGSIVVMTGGTTGQPKSASRKPSVLTFLPPLAALLTQVGLARHRSVYIATPIFHGFGLASLFIGVVLGVTMYVSRRFDVERACSLVSENRIDVITLVPLMLHRMLKHHADSLTSLKCIISGGATLNPALAAATLERVGPILFNMYGTSEAGVCVVAVPELLQLKPESIGRPIVGVRASIRDENDQPLTAGAKGRLCIRSAWTTSRGGWVDTGDLAYFDAEGDLHLCGRVDDMIVSGGENVYPVELENILSQHADIDSCAVVGIPDIEFGQRLKAVVTAKPGASIDTAMLAEWLSVRAARHQMPAVIEVCDDLPYTSLGKIDRKTLRD